MSSPGQLTLLERAALEAIFAETPAVADRLQQQLDAARVIGRQNTGCGFLTDILVPDTVEPVDACQLGRVTCAHVGGLKHGLGFILQLEGGRLRFLDAYSLAGESTADLLPAILPFRITNNPVES